MVKCKSCAKSYDPDKYDFCPYCGEEAINKKAEPEATVECRACGMAYDPDLYKACPYCGEEKQPDKLSRDEETTVREAESDTDRAEKKSSGRQFKYIAIGLAAALVIAAAVYALFNFGESAVTVPDKYATIQEAIDAAEDGEVIVIQAGIYRENIDFKGKNITLQSVDPDDPAVVENTIIDGGGAGTVVSFRSGETENAVLRGLTITRGSGVLVSGGSSPVIEKCVIEDNTAEFGAGIAIFDSSPTIRNNLITANSGFLGGGLFIEESSPVIRENTITSNRAEMGSGMVIISNSTPVVSDNVIANNVAARLGGGIVIAVNSKPTITDNVITDNQAERNGGGLLIEESEPVIENNTVAQNRAANGGGIFIVNTLSLELVLRENSIADNLAYIAGGGLYMEGSSPTVENNDFLNNTSEHLGGAVAVYNSAPLFRSNLFENNRAQDAQGGGAIWVSLDSNLDLNEPDDNTYRQNLPNDLYEE